MPSNLAPDEWFFLAVRREPPGFTPPACVRRPDGSRPMSSTLGERREPNALASGVFAEKRFSARPVASAQCHLLCGQSGGFCFFFWRSDFWNLVVFGRRG